MTARPDTAPGGLLGSDSTQDRPSTPVADATPREWVTEAEAMKGGRWVNADDIDRMVREMDVAMNGDGAARQAKLCDLVDQVKSLSGRLAEEKSVAPALSEQQTRSELLRANLLNSVLEEALRPFAAIVPSSLYPADGSEGEEYMVLLREPWSNPLAFTGAQLRRAREALSQAERTKG